MIQQEDGTWVQKVWPNRPRTKGCMILYNNTHIAGIGGTVTGENSDKIDTYDFFIDEFKENVATLEFNRTQHQCALIPEGDNGHPTVVICKYFETISLPFIVYIMIIVLHILTELALCNWGHFMSF